MEESKGGRPSKWQNQPTQMIRVPSVLVEQILEIAHRLDVGETVTFDSKLQTDIDAALMAIAPPERRAARRYFNKLRDRLAESMQVKSKLSMTTSKELAQKEDTTTLD